jgi:predicted phosphoribosyltransferase
MFKDRYDAARQLAQKLEKYRNMDGVVLAVPRGGVPIGHVVANELGLPLEIVLSKKIGHPYNQELSIGSVSMGGTIIENGWSDVSSDYIFKESDRILKGLHVKFKMYMGNRKSVDLKNKTVIVIDDGITTGCTVLVTVNAIRKSSPREIKVAVPVSAPSSVSNVARFVDDFICLNQPDDFLNVGQFYSSYTQVSDEEIVQLMQEVNPFRNVA